MGQPIGDHSFQSLSTAVYWAVCSGVPAMTCTMRSLYLQKWRKSRRRRYTTENGVRHDRWNGPPKKGIQLEEWRKLRRRRCFSKRSANCRVVRRFWRLTAKWSISGKLGHPKRKSKSSRLRACHGRVRGKLHRYEVFTESSLISYAGSAWVKSIEFQPAPTMTMSENIGNIIISRPSADPQTLSALLDLISFNVTFFRQAQDLDDPDSRKLRKLEQCIGELIESVFCTEAPIDVPRQSRTSFSPIQVNDGDLSSRHAISSDGDGAIEDIMYLMDRAAEQIDSNELALPDSIAQSRRSLWSHNDRSVTSRSVSAADANDSPGKVQETLSESTLHMQHE